MDKKRTSPHARGRAALLKQLARVHELDRILVEQGGPSPQARLLALWQARRLAATYGDFGRRERFRGAVQFFFEDLYGPGDFSQRDADMEAVLPVMSRVLPTGALDALTTALELHTLTQELDRVMLEILTSELGMQDALDGADWAEAYRRCGRRAERERQIGLVGQVGHQLEDVVRRPLVYGLVLLARGPAHAAGFGDLQAFIERGFRAFRGMGGAREFVDEVVVREQQIMERLFAGETPRAWSSDPGRITLDDLGAE